MESNQPRRFLHKLKYKMSTLSHFFKLLIGGSLVVILLLVQNYHIIMSDHFTEELKAANISSKEFAIALKEYRKLMELKTNSEPKLSQDFVKLVEKFKQSASQDLLQQLYQVEKTEVSDIHLTEANNNAKNEPVPLNEAENFHLELLQQQKKDYFEAPQPEAPLEVKPRLDYNSDETVQTIIRQADIKSQQTVMTKLVKSLPESSYYDQWFHVAQHLQNVTNEDKPNPYVRWTDRWEPLPEDFVPNFLYTGQNRSVPQPLLVYNKVPRAGSGVVHTIMKDLMPKLNYTFDHLPSSNMLLNTYMELDIFQQMYRKAGSSMEHFDGFVADCYFNYVDVGAYGLSRDMARPNWINVVREPISRFVSHFYYMARDWRMQNQVLPPEEAKRFAGVDLDVCLRRNGDPCQFFALQYEFFCGNSMACRREDRSSVQRAMYNADRYFSVLGLTEDLDTTFRLLEAYLPRFFAGATQTFRNRGKRNGDGQIIEQYRENVTDHPDVGKEAQEILKQHVHFSREIEFYEFAKQRFHRQVQRVL